MAAGVVETLDTAAIRQQLERILTSPSFATAGRHSRLLRYVVERTLAGEGDQLKEYVLGTEVFDRADSYDPRIDSIVRVEVRRLRSRLDEYYRSSGGSDEIEIHIPRGSYVPVFAARPRALSSTAAAQPAVPIPTSVDKAPSARVPLALIAATLTVLVAIVAAGVALNQTREAAEAASTPSVAVLPFEHFSTNEPDQLLVAHLTDIVTAELARTPQVSVASRTTAAGYAGKPIRAVADALNVDFVMESSAVVTGDIVHVVARMVDARTDRKVWVGEYDVPRSEIAARARAIAIEALTGILDYLGRKNP